MAFTATCQAVNTLVKRRADTFEHFARRSQSKYLQSRQFSRHRSVKTLLVSPLSFLCQSHTGGLNSLHGGIPYPRRGVALWPFTHSAPQQPDSATNTQSESEKAGGLPQSEPTSVDESTSPIPSFEVTATPSNLATASETALSDGFPLAVDPESLFDLGLIGWTPPSFFRLLYGGLHTFTGMPWWLTIISISLLTRLAVLPLNTRALRQGEKLQSIQPVLKDYMDELKAASQAKDTSEKTRVQIAIQDIFAKHQVNPLGFVPIVFLQGAIAMSQFFALKKMVAGPQDGGVPSMAEGGIAWFPDLTQTDPYYVLPVVASAAAIYTLQRSPLPKTYQRTLVTTAAVVLMPTFMSFLPAGQVLYILSASVLQMPLTELQTRSTSFREKLGLGPAILPEQTKTAGKQYPSVAEQFRASSGALQKLESLTIHPAKRALSALKDAAQQAKTDLAFRMDGYSKNNSSNQAKSSTANTSYTERLNNPSPGAERHAHYKQPSDTSNLGDALSGNVRSSARFVSSDGATTRSNRVTWKEMRATSKNRGARRSYSMSSLFQVEESRFFAWPSGGRLHSAKPVKSTVGSLSPT